MDQTNWTTVASTSIPSASRKTDSIDNPDDATWILTSAFIIFTMQSGFGLLESDSVSRKNEANIFVKNAIDVIFGGLSYWIFGFAFTFAFNHRGNGFCGLGYFLTDADENQMGKVFLKYFFQLSFATTATTIVSGAMAERTSLKAYIMYSFLNTLTYSFPAHWIWDHSGWLNRMGAVDIAGCGPVHLVGGVSGLVATLMLKKKNHLGSVLVHHLGRGLELRLRVLLPLRLCWMCELRLRLHLCRTCEPGFKGALSS